MNLVSCAEKCEYQQDGLCQLPNGACASASPIKDCCYFVPIQSRNDKLCNIDNLSCEKA